MKAIVQEAYGRALDALHIREIDEPEVGAGDVKIRVHAASVHADIWHVVTGRPYVLRLMGNGLRRPKHRVPGIDAAGTVVEVGRDVTRFSLGDEVYGEIVRGMQWINGGAYAEYASVPDDSLAPKPRRLSFVEAAAVPTSALIG